MSLLGSLNAAVAGMNAQSTALSSISDNVANSQTVGYKATNTNFKDYVTVATATSLSPGAVVATPEYTNSVQGTITQVSNATSLAVSGSGFFQVQMPTGTAANGTDTFSSQQYYTRVGDFSTDSNGYLVNSSGYVLDGWAATNSTGTAFNTNNLSPIKISTSPSPPVATTSMSLAANLPSTPPTGTSEYTSTSQIYDSGGNAQSVTMTWDQMTAAGPVSDANPISTTNPVVPNQWALTVSNSNGYSEGPLTVQFGTTAATAGTITSITNPANPGDATVPTSQAVGSSATLNLSMDFGLGAQTVALNLGNFGQANGITQYAATSYTTASQTQNGSAQGNFSSVSIQTDGNVVINYDNGTTSTIAQIPLVNFNNPDGLQSQSGQAYTATQASGNPNVVSVGTGGTGSLVVGAEEASNVDIGTEFTQMIVAQQAYAANSKVITTANQMLQTTINMIQA